MNVKEYIQFLTPFENPVMEKIFTESKKRGDIQPPVEPELGRFLGFLVRIKGAKRVLELGTSAGFSTMWLAEALRETGGELFSIDAKERLHLEALENIREANLSKIANLICGDAEEEIEKLEGGFDIIFQDCGKYLYPKLLEKTLTLLNPGGVIVADDTLFMALEDVRESLKLYTHDYNRMVFADERLYSVILPVGHGITLSLKR